MMNVFAKFQSSSRFFLIILFILTGFFTFSLSRSIYTSWESNKKLELKRQEVLGAEEDVWELEKRVEFYHSDDFLEQEARNKLQMIKPGETLVVLPEDVQGQLKEEAEEGLEDSNADQKNSFDDWFILFWGSNRDLKFKFDF